MVTSMPSLTGWTKRRRDVMRIQCRLSDLISSEQLQGRVVTWAFGGAPLGTRTPYPLIQDLLFRTFLTVSENCPWPGKTSARRPRRFTSMTGLCRRFGWVRCGNDHEDASSGLCAPMTTTTAAREAAMSRPELTIDELRPLIRRDDYQHFLR
jgi:hypothetical protein